MKRNSSNWTVLVVAIIASLAGAASAQQNGNTTTALSNPAPGKTAREADDTRSERIACLYLASKKGDESAREKLAKISQKMPSWTSAVIKAVEQSERDAANPMLQGEWGRATPAVSQSPNCD